jgi:hypothetical protein
MQDDRADDIERLKNRIEKLEDVLHRIRTWCEAYPKDIFLPVSEEELKRAVIVLRENGMRVDALYGEWGRHILSAIHLMILASEKNTN